MELIEGSETSANHNRTPGLDVEYTLHPALEDGTDRGFRNVGKPQSDAGELPKRIHTIFKHGESLKSRIIRFLKRRTDRISTRVVRRQCGLSEGRHKLTLLETTLVQ